MSGNTANKGNCQYIEYKGKAKSLAEWAKIAGLPEHVLGDRLRYGWDIEKAMTTPMQQSYLETRMKKIQENCVIGANLKRLRTERGISQAELADKAEVSQPMIAQIERGTKALTVSLGIQVAKVLKVDFRDLIEEAL